MISYAYAKLAIGDSHSCGFNFFDQTVQFTEEKNRHNDAKVFVVTDNIKDVRVENFIKKNITEEQYPFFMKNAEKRYYHFNFSLKVLAFELCLNNTDSEYIIYTDSDFLLHEDYSEEKFQKFLEGIKEDGCEIFSPISNKIDVLDENHFITKYYHPYSFKMKNYDLSKYLERDLFSYDEKFLVLKNNNKARVFVDRWKELYWYMVENEILQYADSLEIGMSSYDARLNNKNLTKSFLYNDLVVMNNMFYSPYCSGEAKREVYFN
jgi:hypothetical protein